MKIVTRAQLMDLPAGTVFSHYEPCIFEGLYIKADPNYTDDFFASDLIGAIDHTGTDDWLDKADRMEKGESLPVNFEDCQRDGTFNHDQLYAVYERADVEKLIKRLQQGLG